MTSTKRKNTETKQVEKPSPKGCLAQYLAMNVMGTGFIALISFSTIYATLRDYPEYVTDVRVQLMAYVAISILTFICAIGLTRWKHWAFYGTLITFGFYILLSFLLPFASVYGLLCLGWSTPLIIMMYPKRHFFD